MKKRPPKTPCHKTQCGPCQLCLRSSTRYFHLSTSSSVSLNDLIQEKCPEADVNECICNACRQKYTKKLKEIDYTPEKSRKKRRSACFLANYSLCDAVSEVESTCSVLDFNCIFGLECSSIPDTIPLCKKHTNHISNMKSKSNCSVCNSNFKNEKKYGCRNFSQTAVLKLQQVNDQFVIHDESVICPSCYRYALRAFSNQSQSISELESSFQKNCVELDVGAIADLDIDEALFQLLNKTFTCMCRILESNKGFLLSTAYDNFLHILDSHVKDESLYNILKKTKTYLHTKILDNFGNVLTMHKLARKRGILFYLSAMSPSDMLEAWHLSCSELRLLKNKQEDASVQNESEHDGPVNTSAKINSNFRHIFNQCNDNVRFQGKQIREKYVKDPFSVLQTGLNDLLSCFHPLVWNAICLLTANNEESAFFRNASVLVEEEFLNFPSDSTKSGEKRKRRRIVLTCLIQYILNEENSYPLHVVTATYIKRLSRSSRLLKMCNNLGFSCSEDTLNRYWQEISTSINISHTSYLSHHLRSDSLTVISIDNIDVLSPFAAVTIDKQRSWHGTSIMGQQPKPLTEKLHTHEKIESEIPICDEAMEVDISLPSTSVAPVSKITKPHARRKISLIEKTEVPSEFPVSVLKTFVRSQLNIDNFSFSSHDGECFNKSFLTMFTYVAERYYNVCSDSPNIIPSIKCKLALQASHQVEKSSFSYLYVLDEKADSADTLVHCLGLLYELFEINNKTTHLIVAGDGATIKLLMNIKKKYGEQLDWVIPFIGDWHVLKNFQEVLMKIFWHSGLKDVAKLAHKQMTLQSLVSCSNFKRTHRFLMQCYEAIFMCLLNSFLEYRKDKEVSISRDDLMAKIGVVVSSLTHENGEHQGIDEFKDAEMHFMSAVLPFVDEFNSYCKEMSQKCETFKFWNQFIREDCLCYVNLFIAMRTGNWNLRLASLKKMVPLFQAFDRQNYASIIPSHLSMIYALPDFIREHFERGAFVCSVKGNNFSDVGFDEAHEMLINKDCKMALTHSLPKDMNKLATTIQHQSKLLSHFEEEMGIVISTKYQHGLGMSVIKSEFNNVKAYYDTLKNTNIFSHMQATNLFQLFTDMPATPVQQKSLMNYRQMGEDAYIAYCQTFLLGKTSVDKPVIRKFRLKTFLKEKPRQKKISDLEKEKNLITLCYKRTIAHSEETKKPISDLCQFITVPRAICSQDGLPYKGAKSVIYNYLDKRYSSQYQIISHSFNFTPADSCVVIEGMNIIYTSPLKHFKLFKDYAEFLVQRWVSTYFRKGFKEVRILFDQNETQGLSPKGMERSRRDKVSDEEEHFDNIDDNVTLPKKWMNFLKNRTQKHMLCRYLSRKFVELVPPCIKTAEQIFVTSGGFHVGIQSAFDWSGVEVTINGQEKHHIVHNHEESDTQIWLHVFDTKCSNILIYSIDRDIGMIGLPLDLANKSVIIQFDAKHGQEKFLNLNNLQSACEKDSDLSQLHGKGIDIKKCIQALYICSGCDFVSFFAHLGKHIFFKTFFHYAPFITGCSSPDAPGTLCQTRLSVDGEFGLLSFYRLILCVYFNANRACLHDFTSPNDLFNSVTCGTILDHHIKALDIVRKASWKGVYEDGLLPSSSALKLHWQRSCWVQTVWSQVRKPIFNYPDIGAHGFSVSRNDEEIIVSCQWDTEENMTKIKSNVLYLTRGCACAKSKCLTRLCKCKKENRICGPGCRCKHCENIESSMDKELSDDELDTSDEEHSDTESERTLQMSEILSDVELDSANDCDEQLFDDSENSDIDVYM